MALTARHAGSELDKKHLKSGREQTNQPGVRILERSFGLRGISFDEFRDVDPPVIDVRESACAVEECSGRHPRRGYLQERGI